MTAERDRRSTMRSFGWVLMTGGAAVALLSSTATWAQRAGETAGPSAPAVYEAVLACGAIEEGARRLECFDRSVAALKAATTARQVVVVDRTTIREARRGLFGLKLPTLKLFGGDNDADEVRSIDSTITGVRTAPDGMPVFVLADGSRWKQTVGRNVFGRAGQPIHIKRSAMGGFMANVNKQSGVNVIRLSQ